MFRNQGQRLCPHLFSFDFLLKSFEIYINQITVSYQNLGKSSAHQTISTFGSVYFGVHSSPRINRNSNISTTDEYIFMKGPIRFCHFVRKTKLLIRGFTFKVKQWRRQKITEIFPILSIYSFVKSDIIWESL